MHADHIWAKSTFLGPLGVFVFNDAGNMQLLEGVRNLEKSNRVPAFGESSGLTRRLATIVRLLAG
jgi:hypothetical protein